MDLTPLRHRDYRLLFIAQFVSLLGTMITYVALPYQMYRATGSTLSVGLLGVAELLPLLATAFIGGALADAVDRRRMAIVTDIGLAAGSVALVIAATAGSGASILYVVAAWMAGVGGLQRPSIDSLVPRLVAKDEIAGCGGPRHVSRQRRDDCRSRDRRRADCDDRSWSNLPCRRRFCTWCRLDVCG